MKMRRGTPAFYTPFVAQRIMAWVLAGLMVRMGPIMIRSGLISAGFVWFGFVPTAMAVNNAFGGRKTMLTVIDAGHWLGVLLIMGAVIGTFAS